MSYEQPSICKEALECYQKWYEKENDNIRAAYDDLEFRVGNQWPAEVVAERASEKRPMLTINRIPQFVRQVTGDMRRTRSAIKVVPVDQRGDPDTADILAGMVRYVENRSEAGAIYTTAADSQVVAGIGHWKVITEYASDTTFEQELRIVGVADSVAVAWDLDSILPTREDATWCIVPVDITRESYKARFPDQPVEDFDVLPGSTNLGASYGAWYSKDMVRIGEYWKKEPIKRRLALYPDGTVDDITDGEEDAEAPPGARIEERDGFKITRYLVSAAHLLETTEWMGRHIPVIPALGEETRIGRRIVRHGLIRFAKDAQRSLNYFTTAHTEVVGLQPKAPFLGTETNFEKYQEEWQTANRKNWPYLPYTPDPANGGQQPSRVAPPVASQGIIEGIQLAVEDMKAVIGIYDASLGAKSNETSGRAILARQREGDVGTYVYIDNFNRAIRRTGTILVDLIPHVYDTERQIRIMGEDGHVELKWINRPVGMGELDPQTGEMNPAWRVQHDVTIGAYDVVMDNGPSYTTKMDEARDGMSQFIQSAPNIAPAVMDLIAQAQDWPLKEEFAERLKAIAPPPVQNLIQKKQQEQGGPQNPPSPQEIQAMQAQQQQMQLQMQAAQLELQNKALENEKLKAEIENIRGDTAVEISKAQMEAQQQQQQPPPPPAVDPMQQELTLRQVHGADLENEIKRCEILKRRAEILKSGTPPEGVGGVGPSDEDIARYADPAGAAMRDMAPILQALAETIQSGLITVANSQAQLAAAINQPKVIIRDNKNQIVGAAPAPAGTLH